MGPKRQKIIFPFLIIASILAIFCLFLLLAGRDKTAFGLMIGDEDLGGLTKEEIRLKIKEKAANIQTEPLRFVFRENEWQAKPEELGIQFDADQTAKALLSFGRQGGFAANLTQQIYSVFFKKRFALDYTINRSRFMEFLEQKFSGVENPAKNARLEYDASSDKFFLTAASAGEIFDRSQIEKEIERRLEEFSNEPIVLEKMADYPKVTADNTGSGEFGARKILANAPYEMKIKDTIFVLPKETVIDWLKYLPGPGGPETMIADISAKKIQEYLAPMLPAINKTPVNATLAPDANGMALALMAQKGIDLKLIESAANIRQSILEGKNRAELLFAEIEPEISPSTIESLGLTRLLGSGSSDFTGSPNNRIHNIRLGTAKISGVILKSGEEFSFVQKIGEIDEANGYLPELVIKKGKTIPEYGGGVCQVSTTLFRAAAAAGLKITERQPHAFAVKYYSPTGFDSTIYPPHPDLRFLNDTPNNILLQAKIEGTKINFEIYGTSDGRQTKIIGPIILESNPDGSMKTILYQEIWRDDKLEKKIPFSSNYKSPNLYPVEKPAAKEETEKTAP